MKYHFQAIHVIINTMNRKQINKFTYAVNTLILMMVFGLMAFFWVLKVPFLVYFSIPTICVYLIGYVLIITGHLDIYVWMVYMWLTLYMCVTTICLGYDFGFHLYCMSMISVMFVTEYLAYKLEEKSLKALYVCIAVGLAYLACTGYISYHGPVYDVDKSAAGLFWSINSIIVFGFLIFYNNWLIHMIIRSEETLKRMAQTDKLTGLFNRHYMMEILRKKKDKDTCLTIADIDHFKVINDTYGHSGGDVVLKALAEILTENLPGSDICRWGGEEFLILTPGQKETVLKAMEDLRTAVERYEFIYEGRKMDVTITAGICEYDSSLSVDKWIKNADENLYRGKNSGRNMVV